jgi:hypothetical protein
MGKIRFPKDDESYTIMTKEDGGMICKKCNKELQKKAKTNAKNS